MAIAPRQLEMTLNGALVERTGSLYLTSLRLVFVLDRPEEKFTGVEVPLSTLIDADFNQPLFGANNLSGTIAPVRCRMIFCVSCTVIVRSMTGGVSA